MWIEEKNTLNMYGQYNNIANLYHNALNQTEAIKYRKMAIDGFRKAGDRSNFGLTRVSLSGAMVKRALHPDRESVLEEAILIGHE